MKWLTMFLAPAVSLALAVPAAADIIPLSQLSRYLNNLRTAQGEFTQINGDGSISTGQIYIKRPGRARFEYNAPNSAVMLAGGGRVAIFDDKSNVEPDTYPLGRTPLKLILARNINLESENMVVGHGSDGPTTSVRAQDPAHPEYGSIELVFTDNPVELRQWVITDDVGGQTTVILGELEKGVQISSILFSIPFETEQRQRN